MLAELYVENFALINRLQANLGLGLNVLTGETGAGKSLIIDAVGLLMGGRASQDFIRTGEEKALVQGVFVEPFSADFLNWLKEAGLEPEDGALILVREILKSGRHTCRINSRAVPLSLFREVGRKLVNIHGQHEHTNLFEDEYQLALLDSYGGEALLQLKERVCASFRKIRDIRHKIEEITANAKDAARQIDYLQYQIGEIEDAGLRNGEEEELQQERKFLQNVEKISLETGAAYQKLYGDSRYPGACDLINEISALMTQLAPLDEKLSPLAERIQEVYYLLDDIVHDLADYRQDLVHQPGRLDQVEERLLVLNKLKKKYGGATTEILSFAARAREELKSWQHREENIKELETGLEQEIDQYRVLSEQLTQGRKKSGIRLAEAVNGELKELQMPNARFQVDVLPAEWGPSGADTVRFMICSNLGEEFQPVARVASGGEMSRIMLGMKVILARLEDTPTLIFDEIDSGLGGRVVYSVGEKMSLIGGYAQVICVTHSPVVASFANHHLYIFKETRDGRTFTEVTELNEQEIVEELCRMLAGDNATAITRAQVTELLKMGRNRGKKI